MVGVFEKVPQIVGFIKYNYYLCSMERKHVILHLTSALEAYHPDMFVYKGAGANYGVWETTDFVEVCHYMGVNYARFRITCLDYIEHSFVLLVEMFGLGEAEWEPVFRGRINTIYTIDFLLTYQLGLITK